MSIAAKFEADLTVVLRRLAELGAVLAWTPGLTPAVLRPDATRGWRPVKLVSWWLMIALCERGWVELIYNGHNVEAAQITEAGRAALARGIQAKRAA